MPVSVAPPGWPENVRPPGAPDWDVTAVAYLFDCCPADFRGYRVLRHHPLVLAQFAEHFVEGQCRAVQEGLARFTTAALTERLRTAGVAFGRVNTVEEFASHPQLRLTEVETQGDERVHLPASPVVWAEASEGDEARRGSPRIPALDEHGAALRSEFG